MRYTLRRVMWLMALLLAIGPPVLWARAVLQRTLVAPALFLGANALAKTVEPNKTTPGPNKMAEFDQAIENFQRHAYEQTLHLLPAATKQHPQLLPARLTLAWLFLANNQLPMGRSALAQAATEQAGYPGISHGFGNLALAEGRLQVSSQ